jgi:hypothetical protein
MGKNPWHVAERRVDRETGEQHQERIVQIRQVHRVRHQGANVGRAAAAINRQEFLA